MSSWRFSSFFKGIWTAYFGWTLCSYSSRPQGRPRALFVALQWGLRPTHRPSGCAWQTRARPRDGIAGEGRSRGGGAGSRASDAPSHQHLPSFCSLCAPDTAVGGHVFRSKELGTFSNVICGNVFHCVVFLMALLRNYLHKTKFNTCTVQ